MKFIFSLFVVFISIVCAQNKMEIKDAWIRPGAQGMNTAMYFDISNLTKQADTLYKVESNISNIVELHETYQKGEMMGMRKIDNVVIKANSSFNFKPGGNHVMLIDLKKKLKVGESYEADLYFRKAGKIKIKALVKR